MSYGQSLSHGCASFGPSSQNQKSKIATFCFLKGLLLYKPVGLHEDFDFNYKPEWHTIMKNDLGRLHFSRAKKWRLHWKSVHLWIVVPAMCTHPHHPVKRVLTPSSSFSSGDSQWPWLSLKQCTSKSCRQQLDCLLALEQFTRERVDRVRSIASRWPSRRANRRSVCGSRKTKRRRRVCDRDRGHTRCSPVTFDEWFDSRCTVLDYRDDIERRENETKSEGLIVFAGSKSSILPVQTVS